MVKTSLLYSIIDQFGSFPTDLHLLAIEGEEPDLTFKRLDTERSRTSDLGHVGWMG